MKHKKRIALSLPAPTGTVADTIALAQQAEAQGYDDLWLADAGGLDALTLAPMILEKTKKVRVGQFVLQRSFFEDGRHSLLSINRNVPKATECGLSHQRWLVR